MSLKQTPSSTTYAYGFSFWKRPIVKSFFPEKKIKFVNSLRHLNEGADLILWGMNEVEGSHLLSIKRVEDGFVRSVGLGSDLVRPLSWVIDDMGIYYDSTQPSRLEWILQNKFFDTESLERARAIISVLVEQNITKYNIGLDAWERPSTNKKIVLVIGQVEDDASLKYGSPVLQSNYQLLREVKLRNPDAYLVYKPHPDVVNQLRKADSNWIDILSEADEIVDNVGITAMFNLVDEVHTITSLSGFEALLRGKKVVCYGQPFYSGWGLTEDINPILRRSRRLSLEMLVAGAIIEYPTYISNKTLTMITAEEAILELHLMKKDKNPSEKWWRRFIRPIIKVL